MSKIVRNKLFEDPDESYAKDSHPLRWDSDNAHPFGVNVPRAEVAVGPVETTHALLGSGSAFAYKDYEGRIWPDAGVIAFWEAPSKTILEHIWKKLISNPKLEKYNLKEDDIHDFLFDIPNPDQTSDDEDAIYTFDEYPENPKIAIKPQEFEVKLRRPQHTISPLKKKKEKTSYGGGSKLTAWDAKRNIKVRQAERTSESVINESPDYLEMPDKNVALSFNTRGAYPFAFYKGKCTVGPENSTHGSLIKYASKEQKEKFGGNFRKMWDYPGRIWENQKIISFWFYPESKEKFKEALYELEDACQRKGIFVIFDEGGWRVELVSEHPDNKYPLIPIKEFTSSDQRSMEEIEKDHVLSPMQKSKKEVPSGVGSKRYGERKPLAWRQAMYAESVKENLLNENPNAIIKPDVWEKHKDDYNYTPSQKDVVTYDDGTSFAFGYYGPKGEESLFVSNSTSTTHPTLYKRAAKTLLGDRNPTVKEVQEFVGSERGVNSGRIFPTEKVITFWNFPRDYKELMSVVSDLNKRFGPDIKIDDTWLVEVPSGEFKGALEKSTGSWGSWHPRAGHQKFIPFSEYKGGYKRSEAELKSPHLEKDPIKRKEMLKGYKGGSYKTAWGSENDIKWRQKKQTSESFYPRLK